MDYHKLTSPQVAEFIRIHENDDVRELVLSRDKWPELPIPDIAQQIASRRKAKAKLPEWSNNDKVLFPKSNFLEQSSSEVTAKYKAESCHGGKLLDLTGGSGVDAFYLAQNFQEIGVVEPNQELIQLMDHNFRVLGLKGYELYHQSAQEYLNKSHSRYDCIYIDPSRRKEGLKTYRFIDCLPVVTLLKSQLLKLSDKVIIKASPMIDISEGQKELQSVEKVTVISVRNECKEVLFQLGNRQVTESEVVAVNLTTDRKDEFKFLRSEEKELSLEYNRPTTYLYEPNSAILKAGAFKSIAIRFNLNKLHPNTHLYSSSVKVDNFPGRVFGIEGSEPFSWKSLKKYRGQQMNISVRNFPHSVEEVRRNSGIKDGGEKFLFLCKVIEGQLLTLYTTKA